MIANAPNPAGFAILKDHFEDQSISPLGLFAAALVPTLVVVAASAESADRSARCSTWISG